MLRLHPSIFEGANDVVGFKPSSHIMSTSLEPFVQQAAMRWREVVYSHRPADANKAQSTRINADMLEVVSWRFVLNSDAIEEMVKFESTVNVTQQLQKDVKGFRVDQDRSGCCS